MHAFHHMYQNIISPLQDCLTQKVHFKQGVALTGRNMTGPPWSVGRLTTHVTGPPTHRQHYRRRRQTPKTVT